MKKVTKIENTKPQQRKIRRTIKRCHICQKMFAIQKFGDHFSVCCASANEKVQQSRTKSTFKNVRVIPRQVPASMSKNNTVQNQTKKIQSDNRFRIKQMSTNNQFLKKKDITEQKKKTTSNKSQVLTTKNKQEKPLQGSNLTKKQTLPQEAQKEKIETSPLTTSQVTFDSLNNPQNLHQRHQSNSEAGNFSSYQSQQSQLISNTTVINRQESIAQSQPFQQIAEQSSINQINLSENRQETMFTDQISFQQVPLIEQYDIQDLIRSTNSIIEFVNTMNIRGEDDTLNMMVAQLEQLNLIAEQITQLNQLGRSLAQAVPPIRLRMVNIFASRIHQLQTTIINQIGIALMRGFNERIGFEFQNMVTQINPDLKQGFTPAEIDNLFQEKISMTQKQCSICLSQMSWSQVVIELQCCHIFHPDCIKQWLSTSKKCPMCRQVQQEHK